MFLEGELTSDEQLPMLNIVHIKTKAIIEQITLTIHAFEI